MKILLVAEGVHELGDLDDDRFDRGALHEFVRRLLPEAAGPVEFVNRRLDDRRVETQDARKVGRAAGHRLTRRALAWVREARNAGCDAVVLLTDEDREPARHAALDAAQQNPVFPTVRRAFGVPVKTFDAWVLADADALTRAAGSRPTRRRDVEAVKKPKTECEAARDAGGSGKRLRDLYAEVAAAADLDVLRARCPKGFAPFAGRVAALADAA